MDEIRQYSKEWFVTKNQAKISAGKKLESFYEGQDFLKAWKFAGEDVVGTKEELLEKYNQLKESGARNENFFSLDNLIDTFGGIDALFDILDADGDGNVTLEEANAIAAVDTEEFASEVDCELSAMDLYQIYKNATDAEGGTCETNGNVTKYTYKDGSTTDIERDETGNIKSKQTTITRTNHEVKSTKYDYSNNTVYETISDAKGRLRYASVDAPGRVHDTTTTTTYNDRYRTRTEVQETAGRTITKTYNSQGSVIRSSQRLKYNSDGVVGNTQQKDIGDCWVLSGVNALKGTTKGAQIIKDCIKKHPDGSITVTLKGVDKSYKFTPEEIGAREYQTTDMEYASGDIDMNLIEMAIGRYRLELLENSSEDRTANLAKASNQDPLDLGYLEEAMEYLTGVEHVESWSDEAQLEVLNSKQNSSGTIAAVVNFKEEAPDITDGSIIKGHAYSISRVTDDTVFVVNPWDSSKTIAYPKDKFLENCKYMASLDLN